jgi:hypothetical protein
MLGIVGEPCRNDLQIFQDIGEGIPRMFPMLSVGGCREQADGLFHDRGAVRKCACLKSGNTASKWVCSGVWDWDQGILDGIQQIEGGSSMVFDVEEVGLRLRVMMIHGRVNRN